MNQQNMAGMFSRPNDRIRIRLTGRAQAYDNRIHAIRPDLADLAESRHHFSPHYAEAIPFRCVAASTMLRGESGDGARAVSQLLHGETFHLLDIRAHWAWGYCGHDHYVGYVRYDSLVPAADAPALPSHVVTAPGGLKFAAADIKAPVVMALPPGALLSGTMAGDFLDCGDGYVHARHVRLLGEPVTDWVESALGYLGQPYLWGGRGGDGLDCSGLVQAALRFRGMEVARDSDQQAQSIGRALAESEALQRGDLVYFPGHVGIMVDGEQLLHANAYWMRVTVEPLADVIDRVSQTCDTPVTARRRIEA